MSEHILLEEFHLTVTAPNKMSDAKREKARTRLNSPAFRSALRKAVRDLFGRHSELARLHAAWRT